MAPLDVRLSLRTTDRKAARNMGAALTAVTPRVLEMLDRRAKQKTNITEQELQAIAKVMYEERLAEVCTLRDRRHTMSSTTRPPIWPSSIISSA